MIGGLLFVRLKWKVINQLARLDFTTLIQSINNTNFRVFHFFAACAPAGPARAPIDLLAGVAACLERHTPSDDSAAVAPQSTVLYGLQHELETPSLNDVSKSSSSDGTWGEVVDYQHDSPDATRSDYKESESDASQDVAGGCTAHSLDSTPHSFNDPSPQRTTPSQSFDASPRSELESTYLSTQSSSDDSIQLVNVLPQVSSKAQHEYQCSACPRSFPILEKLDRHVRLYKHAHVCPVSGCPWNFDLAKDLRRHLLQHNPQAPRYQCPMPDCRWNILRKSFSRGDRLARHMARFHS